jgi:hypothetical protein
MKLTRATPSRVLAGQPLQTTARRGALKALALGPLGMATAGLTLSGCASGPEAAAYRDTQPALNLKTYFNGKLKAHGMFSDRSGEVLRRFVVTMNCQWRGEEGVLDEDFVYDDGEKQKRIWKLSHLGGGRYEGRADDVVGVALGESSGAAFRWQYTLKLPYKGSTIDVQFDDWMFLVDERVMLNRATMTKFGFKLGEVQLVFDKPT